MLQLNLFVYDENGVKIDALCIENAAPQQINNVWMFLKPGMSYEVSCVMAKVEDVTPKN